MSLFVNHLRVLLFAIVPVLGLSVSAIADEEVAWSTNIEESLRQAAANGKPVLMEFTASWCVYCKRMEKTTFTDPAVVARIEKHFVAVRVDADQHKDLVADLGIKGLPAILVVSPDLQIIERISGFQTAEALVTKLEGVTASGTTATGAGLTAGVDPGIAEKRPAKAAAPSPPPRGEELAFEPITNEDAVPSRRPSVRPVSKQDENPFAEIEATKSAHRQTTTTELPVKSFDPPESESTDVKAAFGGLCLVSAVEDRELVDGTEQSRLNYRGHVLQFRSEEHKKKYLAQPNNYWPMLDGACAMTLLDTSERVEGELQFAAVFRKRIWLFTNEAAMREFLLDPSDVAEEIAELPTTARSR